jgi:hypothetical protein
MTHPKTLHQITGDHDDVYQGNSWNPPSGWWISSLPPHTTACVVEDNKTHKKTGAKWTFLPPFLASRRYYGVVVSQPPCYLLCLSSNEKGGNGTTNVHVFP